MNQLPIGFIAMFPGENIPEGWRICNGQSIEKSDIEGTFDVLAAALGQTEAAEETLQLPNLTDRFVVGAGTEAELRSSGEPDQHSHQNDPPPQRRYTSYGDQFVDAASTQYFKQGSSGEELEDIGTSGETPHFQAESAPPPPEDLSASPAPMSLEHHNHYVELDIEPFSSEPSEGLNRPRYYAVNFVIRVA